jgi:glutamate-1-semialdehyde 2,1-aminomutase
LFGIKPHLTTLAKALGNNYPISAICALEEMMRKYATQEILPQSTYARNLVTLAAADATLDKIKTGDVNPAISKFGNSLMKGIQDILQDKKVDAMFQVYPSMFQVPSQKKKELLTIEIL